MRLRHAQRIEHADRIGRHVLQQIGRQNALAAHRLAEGGRHRIGRDADLAGFADVAIVEADDVVAARRQRLAEGLVPDDHLRAQPHDQQQGGICRPPEGLAADVDAIGLDEPFAGIERNIGHGQPPDA